MRFTRTTFIRFIKIGIIVVVGVVILVLGISRSVNYLRGPSIVVYTPTNGYATTSVMIDIYGQAQRVSSIALNRRPMSIDENGNFKEIITLFNGMNIITVSAKDRFGREIERQLSIVRE